MVVGSIEAGRTAVGGQDGRLSCGPPTPRILTNTSGADGTGAWTWIGFTTQASGFAIDEAGHLFHTTDGGAAWAKVTFRP